MSKIHFTLFSQAYYVDTNWGFGCPSGGIKNMGDIAHKYNIPITWLLSPKSARCEVEMLTSYHEKYGDEAAMMFRFPAGEEHHHSDERAVAEGMSVENFKKHIISQKNSIEKVLPWANVKICGQGIRTKNFMIALQELGFEGVFGHCYCQIGTDSITDFGMPWGSFRMRPQSAHLPAKEGQEGLISFEWTMRDLNKSMHTTRPELWSTDPNDVERGGVCSDENVEYWKNMFQEYEKALKFNPHGIWFQFHQEAHEQTWGEVCHPLSRERVEFCTNMMDLFFSWLIERDDVEFLTATQAALKYRNIQKRGTLPMYVPFDWVEVPEKMEFWDQVRQKEGYAGNIHKNAHLPDEDLYEYLTAVNNPNPMEAMKNPPWSKSFFYFDQDCQLAFDYASKTPFILLNYLNYEPTEELKEMFQHERGGGAAGFFIESGKPEIVEFDYVPDNSKEEGYFLKFTIRNKRDKNTPYGLFFWSDIFKGVERIFEKSQEIENASHILIHSKIIEEKGVFLRLNLDPGQNKIQF